MQPDRKRLNTINIVCGEDISLSQTLAATIICDYVGFLSLIICPCIILISMISFEHIDKDALDIYVPINATFIAALIMIILHESNIATFALF